MIKLQPTSWKIMLEVLVKAHPTKVVEVPIQFERRAAGESKFTVKQMKAYLKHLILLWIYQNKRVFKFCMVGGSGAVITFGLTWALTELIGLWYMLSLVIAVAIATIWNYNFNKWWTFAQDRSPDCASYDWESFYKGNPFQRWWKQGIAKVIWNWIPGSSKLLDIGCGSSPIISRYPEAVATDINKQKLAFLKEKMPSLEVKAMSADTLLFEDEQFDYVICSEVLEHLETPRIAIGEIARVLRSGGRVVLATPDYNRKHWLLAEKFTPAGNGHISHFTRRSLEEMCREFGLVPIQYKYIAGCDLVELFEKRTDNAAIMSRQQVQALS